jgi:hypothetical protein
MQLDVDLRRGSCSSLLSLTRASRFLPTVALFSRYDTAPPCIRARLASHLAQHSRPTLRLALICLRMASCSSYALSSASQLTCSALSEYHTKRRVPAHNASRACTPSHTPALHHFHKMLDRVLNGVCLIYRDPSPTVVYVRPVLVCLAHAPVVAAYLLQCVRTVCHLGHVWCTVIESSNHLLPLFVILFHTSHILLCLPMHSRSSPPHPLNQHCT